MTYAEKLKDPKWQRKRLEILTRDNWTCKLCGDKETTLHIHHFCYNGSGNPWDSDSSDLICYCKHCHYITENFQSVFLAVRKSKIDDTHTLLIAFSLSSYLYILIYDDVSGKETFSMPLPYKGGNNLILPIDIPEKWTCFACGSDNVNTNICRVCRLDSQEILHQQQPKP